MKKIELNLSNILAIAALVFAIWAALIEYTTVGGNYNGLVALGLACFFAAALTK